MKGLEGGPGLSQQPWPENMNFLRRLCFFLSQPWSSGASGICILYSDMAAFWEQTADGQAGSAAPTWGSGLLGRRRTPSAVQTLQVGGLTPGHGLSVTACSHRADVKTTGWFWTDLQHSCRVNLGGHLPSIPRAGVSPCAAESLTRHNIRR